MGSKRMWDQEAHLIRHPYGGPAIWGVRLKTGDSLRNTDVFATTDQRWSENPIGEGIQLGVTNLVWVRPKPQETEKETAEIKPEYRLIDAMDRSRRSIHDLQDEINRLHKEGYDYFAGVGPYLLFRRQEIAIDRESNRCGECPDCLVVAEYLKTTVPNYLKERACQRPKPPGNNLEPGKGVRNV